MCKGERARERERVNRHNIFTERIPFFVVIFVAVVVVVVVVVFSGSISSAGGGGGVARKTHRPLQRERERESEKRIKSGQESCGQMWHPFAGHRSFRGDVNKFGGTQWFAL